MIKIKMSSKYSIEEWLDAVSRGHTPRGVQVKVTNLNNGDIVEVCFAGRKGFGSGGYGAGAEYAGKPPLFLGEVKVVGSKFASAKWGKFKFFSPSVVYHWEVDYCWERRVFLSEVFVCASSAHIAAAQKKVAASRKAEAATANLQILIEYLVKKRLEEAEHIRTYHKNGCCYYGSGAGEEHARFSTYGENKILFTNNIDERILSRLPSEIAKAIRRACFEGIGPQILEKVAHEIKLRGQKTS